MAKALFTLLAAAAIGLPAATASAAYQPDAPACDGEKKPHGGTTGPKSVVEPLCDGTKKPEAPPPPSTPGPKA